MKCKTGGQFKSSTGQVEVPGVDIEALDLAELLLEPEDGGLARVRRKRDNNVAILRKIFGRR